MRRNICLALIAFMLTGLLLTGCKKWDDHNAVTDPMAGKDLFQQISENADLSKFAELLTKSGYDKVIGSSKTFTVFAPTNAALTTLDPAIISDTTRLKMFVANHITYQTYQTVNATSQLRLLMLNGKYNNMVGSKFEDANITQADRYAKNGILQVIDKMTSVLPNAWEFLETSPLVPAKQKTYLQSLYRNVFDPVNAQQTGVDPVTGRPIYKAGTDSVRTNLYWRDVYDLRNEQKQYTFFVLSDAAWDAELNRYKTYFATGSTDSTLNLASNAVVRDLAIEGVYQQSALPDTIVSKFNIKVGINKNAIVQTVKVSNGIVYVLNNIAVRPKDRFQPIVVEAENYNFSRVDRSGNTWLRDKINTVTGKNFKDVLVHRHGVAQFWLGYRLPAMPTNIKYRVYWVALNDNINGITGTFRQRFTIGDPLGAALPFVTSNLPYITVSPNNYNEVLVGDFTMLSYLPSTTAYFTADNTTSEATNLIVADYFRLEPLLP